MQLITPSIKLQKLMKVLIENSPVRRDSWYIMAGEFPPGNGSGDLRSKGGLREWAILKVDGVINDDIITNIRGDSVVEFVSFREGVKVEMGGSESHVGKMTLEIAKLKKETKESLINQLRD